MSDEKAAAEAALKQREQAVAAREAAADARDKAAQAAEFAAFANDLAKQGRLLPAHTTVVTEILTALATHKEPSAAFAAGDENHGKTPLDLAKGLLAAMPVRVPLGTLGRPSGAATDAAFAVPDGFATDAAQVDLLARAREYQGKNPGVDLVTAYKAVGGK